MQEISRWWAQKTGQGFSRQAKPWLLLGKGPTFHEHRRHDLSCYHTIAINHVIREVCVDFASVVDIDVIADCGASIHRNARFLLMPRYPYDLQGKQSQPLEAYFDALPVLRKLSAEGRLICYNLGGEHCAPDALIVPPGAFSAEILVNLLSRLGTSAIRTLGIDGGKRYDATFGDLEAQTCLKNGQESFDVQFEGIARAVRQYHLDYAALALPAALQHDTLARAYRRGMVRGLFPAWLREQTRPLRHSLKRQWKRRHTTGFHSVAVKS